MIRKDEADLKKNCFVIMPFGGKFDDYYNNIYKKAIENCELISRRADDIYKSTPIISDIWTYVLTADVILADLSGKNPNVMYELGLAHALSKPVILLSDSLDSVPFDLKHIRVLLYEPIKSDWSITLQKDIEKYLLETIDSPKESIIPTFLEHPPSDYISKTSVAEDILDIKDSISHLLSSQNDANLSVTNAIYGLSKKDHLLAKKYAHKMYFEEGLTLEEIKESLANQFKIEFYLASDIVNRSIRPI